MKVPGIPASHQKITPTCRSNRGTTGALDEAINRIRAAYIDYASDECSEQVTWHLVLVREDG